MLTLRRPRLSIVVVVFRMARQAERTLRSLAPDHQQGVRASDYEIVVVENASDQMLGAERARAIAPNIRHTLREEPQPTPVHAANLGLAQARAPHVALMVDGARMATPGIVRLALAAFRAEPEAAVSAPSYHLGPELQQLSVPKGHDEAADDALLDGIGWPADGYRLFEVAVFSGAFRRGFLRPATEANFIAAPAAKLRRLGGFDARYDSHGGGKANLDLYKRLLDAPGTPHVVLFGEGTFHQVHGGVTTNTLPAERAGVMAAIEAQDRAIRGGAVEPPKAPPILFGSPHPAMRPFLRHSLDQLG